ncbi:MAG: cytochrome P450 [Solirubrobacterales bacterium]
MALTSAAEPPVAEPFSFDDLPPGPTSSGVVQSLQWANRPLAYMQRARQAHGPVFTARLGPMRSVVFIADPAVAQAVFTGPADVFHTGDINGIFRPGLGSKSILLLDGEEHLRHRRMMLPLFQGRASTDRIPMFEQIARSELERVPLGRPVKMLPVMHRISLEAILLTLFGATDPERYDRLRIRVPRMLDLCDTPAFLLPWLRYELGGRSGWGKVMQAVRDLDEALFEEIAIRRAGGVEGSDGLAQLMAARDPDGHGLDDQALRDELVTLLGAGHETTSGALAWAVERISRAPEVADTLRRQEAVGDPSYTEATVKEALRRRPVLPIVGRTVIRDVEVAGLRLPRGAVAMPCVYLMHHEPSLYPDPYAFRPERFLESSPPSYGWIPFGGGVRRCAGASFATLEMEATLRVLLTSRRLVPIGRPEGMARRSVSMQPSRGAEVALEAL